MSASLMPGPTTARFVDPGGADSLERERDSDDGSEEADVRRHASRRCEERQAPFEFVHFGGRGANQGAINRFKALQDWTRRGSAWTPCRLPRETELGCDLGIAGLKDADERARGKRRTNGLHVRKFLAATKYVEERRGLTRNGSIGQCLEQNDRPRGDREHDQNREDNLAEWTCIGQDLQHASAPSGRGSVLHL